MSRPQNHISRYAHWTAFISLLLALTSLATPVIRAFYHLQVNYNEGWNVYNADTLAHHQYLYPANVGYLGVNYPMLSFAISAALHTVTHDYLYTARALSIASVLMLGFLLFRISRELGATLPVAVFTGCFCICEFCLVGFQFLGGDDPNILALPFYAAALLFYIRKPESYRNLVLVAALIVSAACIKHNPLEFMAAIGADLLIRSVRKAFWWALWLVVLVALAILLHLHFGGPGFITQMTLGRTYDPHMILIFLRYLGKLVWPILIVAVATCIAIRKEPRQRIAVLLFVFALAFDIYFSGGSGVSLNIFFGSLIATAILLGIFFTNLLAGKWSWGSNRGALLLPLFLIGFIAAKQWRNLGAPWQIVRTFPALAEEERANESFVRAQPGQAFCQHMIICFNAGKQYIYDPYNAMRFIALHKVSPEPMAARIRNRELGAIELGMPVEDLKEDVMPKPLLDAIKQNYAVALRQPDGTSVYVPLK